jgi:hypothetical protein
MGVKMCLIHKWRYDVLELARTCINCHTHQTIFKPILGRDYWVNIDCTTYDRLVKEFQIELEKHKKYLESLIQSRIVFTDEMNKCKWK